MNQMAHRFELERRSLDEQLPLDELFYPLSDDRYAEELAFWRVATGINDDAHLKSHILSVQKAAYSIFNYPCIRGFSFLRFNLSRHPRYSYTLKTVTVDKTALFLDVGCFFGTDLRKAIADGYPAQNVMGTDLRDDWFRLSKTLFKTTDTLDIRLIAGDLFDENFLTFGTPATSRVGSLNDYRGRLRFVYTSALFHLFQEDVQLDLARRLSTLLEKKSGAMLFGSHGGKKTKGFREQGPTKDKMFCHSPESWMKMMAAVFAEQGLSIDQHAQIVPIHRPHHGTTSGFTDVLTWSVTIV